MTRTWSLALLAALASGCTDYGFTDSLTVDYFQQNRRNELDLMIVIDNSCSMVEEQENLASNFGNLIDAFARAEVDWQIAVTTTDIESERFRGLLVSGDDEIILRGPLGEIDRVEYNRNWLFEEGVALQLKRESYRPTSNLNRDNWCPAPTEYADQALGSPGEWNPGCDGEAIPVETSGDPDAGPVAPRNGSLVISEIMADARGPDSLCEWFEITNLTSNTLGLGEVTVGDYGNNLDAFPPDATLAPYDVMVVGRSDDPDLNCGVPVDIELDSMILMNHVNALDPDTEDSDDLFNEMIAQGTLGAGIEMGLEAARLSLMEPYYTDQNGAWLRDDASLAVLVVSDENDLSPFNVDFYENFFLETKGPQAYREDGWFTFNAVVGTNPTESHIDISCDSDNGVAYWGQRYMELASRRNGVIESICEEDFSPVVENLGLGISGLESRFTLSLRPILDTLVVKLYEDQDESSLVRELEEGVDFTYEPDGNYLYFSEAQVPPPRYYVTAEYRPAATGTSANGQEQN